MTPIEIAQRLRHEFPERYVAFNLDVQCHERYIRDTEPSTNIEITLYTKETGHIECLDFEDGIRQLKLKLGMIQPTIDLAI